MTLHRRDAAIPVIEVADHTDSLGRGCPDREAGADDTVDDFRMGAEKVMGMTGAAFSEGAQVRPGDTRREAVGVDECLLIAAGLRDQAGMERQITALPAPLKQRGVADPGHRLAPARSFDPEPVRVGPHDAH